MDFKRKVMMPVRMSMVFSGAGGVRRTLTETGNWHHLGGSEHLTVFTSFREPLQCVGAPLQGKSYLKGMADGRKWCISDWLAATKALR